MRRGGGRAGRKSWARDHSLKKAEHIPKLAGYINGETGLILVWGEKGGKRVYRLGVLNSDHTIYPAYGKSNSNPLVCRVVYSTS